jgi:hypothetical protein
MPKQLDDILLHKLTHYTNLAIPYSDYINYTLYPKQDKSMLNKHVNLSYRNLNIFDNTNYPDPESYDEHDIYKSEFRIIRFDLYKPFKMVAISIDNKMIVVGNSSKFTDNKEFIFKYPQQISTIIGWHGTTQFVESTKGFECVVLSADDGEPCNTVIAEFINNKDFRIILGDECFVKLESKNRYSNKEKSIDDIAEIREKSLEGRLLYGSY